MCCANGTNACEHRCHCECTQPCHATPHHTAHHAAQPHQPHTTPSHAAAPAAIEGDAEADKEGGHVLHKVPDLLAQRRLHRAAVIVQALQQAACWCARARVWTAIARRDSRSPSSWFKSLQQAARRNAKGPVCVPVCVCVCVCVCVLCVCVCVCVCVCACVCVVCVFCVCVRVCVRVCE